MVGTAGERTSSQRTPRSSMSAVSSLPRSSAPITPASVVVAPSAREVQRDVCGTAGTLFRGARAHDGHRRLRGNSCGVAEPVLVEHRVARDEQAKTGEVGN